MRGAVKQCDAETYRATAFLKEIDGDAIEVACTAHEAEMQAKLARILEQLHASSLELLMSDRAEKMVLSKLQEVASGSGL